MNRGAVCVDMEAAALFAIAKYRGVKLGAFHYAGDVVGDEWDLRVEKSHENRREEVVRKMLRYSIEVLSKI